MAPYESLRCADREIVIAVTNEKTWASFVALPDFAAFGTDPRYADPPGRNTNRATLVPAIEAILMTRPAAEWLALFDSVGIPAEPINTLPEVMALDQLAQRGMLQPVEYAGQRILTAGMPWRAVAREGEVRGPPGLGAHTEEVLREWGVR